MSTKTGFNYAAKMTELEEILAKLQETNTPLDEAMQLHVQGKALVAELEAFLKTAEHEIHAQVSKAQ